MTGRPKRSLGQNFLRDRTVARRIVSALGLSASDSVVEIGPGRGALTDLIAERAGRLCAVEKDDLLADSLKERFAADGRVSVICADALICEISGLAGGDGPYKLVGNLPYNVASAIIRRFLAAPRPPSLLVAMLQREVADAMTAEPGEMTYLSVEMQVRGSVRKLFGVAPAAFRPVPRVHSAVISVVPHPEPIIDPGSAEDLLRVARAGFAARRKQLRNSLGHGLGLEARAIQELLERAEIDGGRRAQTLSVEEWVRLHEAAVEVAR